MDSKVLSLCLHKDTKREDKPHGIGPTNAMDGTEPNQEAAYIEPNIMLQ